MTRVAKEGCRPRTTSAKTVHHHPRSWRILSVPGPYAKEHLNMSSNEHPISLIGSTKHRLPHAQISGEVPHGEFQVTVMVRRKTPLPDAHEHNKLKPKDRTYMSRETLATTHGADPADIAKVTAFAREHNLKVIESDLAKRHVLLSGTAENYNRAFGVALKMYKSK